MENEKGFLTEQDGSKSAGRLMAVPTAIIGLIMSIAVVVVCLMTKDFKTAAYMAMGTLITGFAGKNVSKLLENWKK